MSLLGSKTFGVFLSAGRMKLTFLMWTITPFARSHQPTFLVLGPALLPMVQPHQSNSTFPEHTPFVFITLVLAHGFFFMGCLSLPPSPRNWFILQDSIQMPLEIRSIISQNVAACLTGWCGTRFRSLSCDLRVIEARVHTSVSLTGLWVEPNTYWSCFWTLAPTQINKYPDKWVNDRNYS